MIYSEKNFVLKDGESISVLSPEASDAKAVLDFAQKITGQTEFFMSCTEDFRYDLKREESYIEGMRSGKGYFLVAMADGKIIADCSLDFDRHIKASHRCSISIGIDKEYWGKGIGSLLMSELIRLAEETDGTMQIELGVISGNKRALNLYRKFGFEESGKVPRAIKISDGNYLDEILMVKYL